MYYNNSNEADCDECFDTDGNFLPERSTDDRAVILTKE